MSTVLSDPLATSEETWRDHAVTEPAIPPELIPPPQGTPRRERLSALRRRHLLREQRALDTYAASRNPVRGWPVADNHVVRAFFRGLLRERKGIFFWLIFLNALAAGTALIVPRLLGDLVDRTTGDSGEAAQLSSLDQLAWVIVAVVCTQALLTFLAQATSTIFGQDLLASAREFIVGTVLRLPLGRVEGASTGDLVTRVTRDVGTMSRSVQFGVPQAIISGLTVALSVVAMLLNSVLLAVPSLLVIGSSWFAVRRYLQRAPKGYITEGSTYSRINTTLTETTEGARTVEALGLPDLRVRAGDDDIAVSAQAERYTMTLRNLLFSVIDIAFNSPRVVTLLVGGYGYQQGWASLGQITTALLYVEALSGPLDRLVGEMDRLQVGVASTSRLLGIAEVPEDRTPGTDRPDGPHLVGEDLRFA
jgi:ABC-type multidrug transport system fused ATPase/permease subunit